MALNEYQVSLARLSADGALDFITKTSVGDGSEVGYGVAYLSDHRIIVGGYGQNDFLTIGYQDTGTLDTTYGNNGSSHVNAYVGDNEANSVLVQSDDKIILIGETYDETGRWPSLVRLNADGSIDASFGVNGIVVTPIGSAIEAGVYPGVFAYAADFQSNESVVVAGTGWIHAGSYAYLRNYITVLRYTPNGVLDTAFGDAGLKAVVLPDLTYAEGRAIVVQNDGWPRPGRRGRPSASSGCAR